MAPSIRSLAVELKVNRNTVALALHELMLEGFLLPRPGGVSVISDAASLQARESVDLMRRRFSEAVALARRGGLNWEEIHEAMRAVRRKEP